MSFFELRRINKYFGAVKALSNVDLKIEEGLIHALIGENGAGKSTLGKVISGVLRYDSGEMMFKGRLLHYGSPRDAIVDGIAAIQQETTVVPGITVLENVFLGIEGPIFGLYRSRQLKKEYIDLCNRSGFNLPPNIQVSSLSLTDKKKVEILRAMSRNAKLIIFDEPTASLGADDAEKLLSIVRGLRNNGTTIIYISHFLEEVLGLADVISVLRNGEIVKTTPTSQTTITNLVEAMLGHTLDLGFPPKSSPTPNSREVLSVSGLTRKGAFKDISLTIREGEIVGLAGLVGSGRTEIARAIFGADPFDSGEIKYYGRSIRIRSPLDAIRLGIALLPENRKLEGLVFQLPLGQNITLPHLESVCASSLIRIKQEYIQTRSILEKLDVRPPKPRTPVFSLSGGNQQKAVFAKWLFKPPHLLILDEPTCGVDVNARRAIYSIITSLAKDGMAVLLISSELEEIAGLANRALVISRGQITSILEGKDIKEETLLKAAFNMQPDLELRNSL